MRSKRSPLRNTGCFKALAFQKWKPVDKARLGESTASIIKSSEWMTMVKTGETIRTPVVPSLS